MVEFLGWFGAGFGAAAAIVHSTTDVPWMPHNYGDNDACLLQI